MTPSIEYGIAGWFWNIVRPGQSRDRQDRAASKLLPILLLIIVALSGLLQSTLAVPVKEVRRILVFDDYDDIASPGVGLLNRAIFAALSKSRYQIDWHRENLEATFFSDETSQRRIREWYIRKYEDRQPDLIVAVGPASLQFMVDSHEKFFPGVPIVFCGSSEEMLEKLKPDSHFTGVWGVVQPKETLKAALRLKPDTKHVVVAGGVGAYDRYLEEIVKRSLHGYESKFDVTYLTDLDMSTLLERLRQLPNNTIVLYTNFVEDAAGARFVGASQSNPMIASAANAPVFVLSDVDLGTGTVGGDMVSFASDGKIAGDIVMRILNGEKPQDIPIVKNANVFMFDWRALQRWGLKEGNLPPGSIVLNRPPYVWKLFKWYIIGGVSLILLEALLISGLVWQRARRRQAETQLSIAYETALETERRFRLVANTAPVMIWMSGRDKLCNYFNRPWLEFTGRPLEAELGNGWLEGVHPEDLKNCLDIYTRAFDSHESFKTQCRLRRHDGEYRWVLDIGVPRLNPDGSFAGYIGSCLDITDHKLADEALAQVGRKLIQAHEEERTWIARELHDDINQRIALLTVQLGVLAQDPPDSGVEVADHIRHVRQDLADLGNDIQSLSHRLHSSKLDLLGLAAAAGGFCRELSEQQKVEIEFRHTGIPRSLPQEISLCLFRVLQEALQNAVKHSGTRHFEVELHGNAEKIELAVRDRGEGFDVEAAAHRSGLGLISMGERVSLIKGTMLIASTPKGGTEIKVRVPLTASDATFRSEATFRSISTG